MARLTHLGLINCDCNVGDDTANLGQALSQMQPLKELLCQVQDTIPLVLSGLPNLMSLDLCLGDDDLCPLSEAPFMQLGALQSCPSLTYVLLGRIPVAASPEWASFCQQIQAIPSIVHSKLFESSLSLVCPTDW